MLKQLGGCCSSTFVDALLVCFACLLDAPARLEFASALFAKPVLCGAASVEAVGRVLQLYICGCFACLLCLMLGQDWNLHQRYLPSLSFAPRPVLKVLKHRAMSVEVVGRVLQLHIC